MAATDVAESNNITDLIKQLLQYIIFGIDSDIFFVVVAMLTFTTLVGSFLYYKNQLFPPRTEVQAAEPENVSREENSDDIPIVVSNKHDNTHEDTLDGHEDTLNRHEDTLDRQEDTLDITVPTKDSILKDTDFIEETQNQEDVVYGLERTPTIKHPQAHEDEHYVVISLATEKLNILHKNDELHEANLTRQNEMYSERLLVSTPEPILTPSESFIDISIQHNENVPMLYSNSPLFLNLPVVIEESESHILDPIDDEKNLKFNDPQYCESSELEFTSNELKSELLFSSNQGVIETINIKHFEETKDVTEIYSEHEIDAIENVNEEQVFIENSRGSLFTKNEKENIELVLAEQNTRIKNTQAEEAKYNTINIIENNDSRINEKEKIVNCSDNISQEENTRSSEINTRTKLISDVEESLINIRDSEKSIVKIVNKSLKEERTSVINTENKSFSDTFIDMLSDGTRQVENTIIAEKFDKSHDEEKDASFSNIERKQFNSCIRENIRKPDDKTDVENEPLKEQDKITILCVEKEAASIENLEASIKEKNTFHVLKNENNSLDEDGNVCESESRFILKEVSKQTASNTSPGNELALVVEGTSVIHEAGVNKETSSVEEFRMIDELGAADETCVKKDSVVDAGLIENASAIKGNSFKEETRVIEKPGIIDEPSTKEVTCLREKLGVNNEAGALGAVILKEELDKEAATKEVVSAIEVTLKVEPENEVYFLNEASLLESEAEFLKEGNEGMRSEEGTNLVEELNTPTNQDLKYPIVHNGLLPSALFTNINNESEDVTIKQSVSGKIKHSFHWFRSGNLNQLL